MAGILLITITAIFGSFGAGFLLLKGWFWLIGEEF